MKICFIHNLYKPFSRGGAEGFVENKAKTLKSEGKEPVIITTKPWSGWGCWDPEIQKEDGVKIYRFWVPNLCWYGDLNKYGVIFKLFWHFFDIFNIFSAFIIKKIIKKEEPKIVNTHNLTGIGFLLPRVINHLDTIFVHTLHDVQLVESSGILPWDHKQDNLFQKIYSGLMKNLFGSPDKVNSPSYFLKDFYQNRGFFKDSEWQVKKFNLEKKRNIKPKNISYSRIIKFLFAGSLEPHKGLGSLMKSWDDYISAGKELHIAGDGSIKEKIREWSNYRQGVKMYGRVSKQKLDKIYNESDVLIFPSVCIENSPEVIKEALNRDLFVVAAATGGVVEFKDYNVWFFEPGNIDEMKQKIAEVSVKVLIKRGLSTEKEDQDIFEIRWAKYFVDYINEKLNRDYSVENNKDQNSDIDVFAVSKNEDFDTLNLQLTQVHPEFFYEKAGGRFEFKDNLENEEDKIEIMKIKYLLEDAIERKKKEYAKTEDIILLLQGYFQVNKVKRAIDYMNKKFIQDNNFSGIYYVFPGINRGGVEEIKTI